jgi:hypothetical protein
LGQSGPLGGRIVRTRKGDASVRELEQFNDCDLVQGYVSEAAWFWFDASTVKGSFLANVHRLVARCLLEEIRQRGLEEPNQDLLYKQARRIFPPDDLKRR